MIVNGNIQYTYLIRISARGLGAATGHLCLVLQSSGNPMLGGLKNCTDCKDFLFERLAEVFSKRCSIFYYYHPSEFDVPTFC